MNSHTFLLQNFLAFRLLNIRTCSQLPKGKKYYGFTYYPRSDDFEDPPYEPSKLFLIKRIKSMRGRDPKEKHILALMNIDGDKKDFGHINVVKNIPPTNALLWKIKHLIEIRPITYKNELPKDGNYSGVYLRETGELVLSPKLQVSPEQLEITEKIRNNPNKLTDYYLKNYLKKKWLDGFNSSV